MYTQNLYLITSTQISFAKKKMNATLLLIIVCPAASAPLKLMYKN